MQDRDLLAQFLSWLRQHYLLAAIRTQEGPLGHSQRVLVVESVANDALIDQYVRSQRSTETTPRDHSANGNCDCYPRCAKTAKG